MVISINLLLLILLNIKIVAFNVVLGALFVNCSHCFLFGDPEFTKNRVTASVFQLILIHARSIIKLVVLIVTLLIIVPCDFSFY